MKFYVASGLKNSHQVAKIIRLLEAVGMECTFNWVLHGSDSVECARQEIAVVKAPNFLVWIPWDSRGNHVEYGVALAADIPVLMLETEGLTDIPFYGLVNYRTASLSELMAQIYYLQ